MPVDTSIYANRTPPDPIAGLGGTVGLANALTQNRMLQGNLQGQTQYGQALMDAGGDPTQATNLFTQRGGNPLYAPQAYGNAATLGGAQISNTNAIAAGSQAQSANVYARLNSLAATGNAKNSDYTGTINEAMSSGALPPAVGASILSRLPRDPTKAAAFIQNETAGFVSPPEQSAPTTAGANESGQAILKPEATVAANARTPGGTVTEAPLGLRDVTAKDRQKLFDDQLQASGTMANVRPLQQALPLIQQLSNQNFGPGSPELAKIKGALTTAGIIDPNTSDLQVRQEVNKYLLKYSSGAIAAGRSDAALSAALGSNPNLDLTQPANLALIKNQIGYDQMDAAMPKAYALESAQKKAAGQPVPTYSEYKAGYYQANDPRAFQFHLLTPDERANVKASLGAQGSAAYQRFVHSYGLAKGTGMLQPPPPSGRAQ